LNFDAKLTLDVSQFIASVTKAESAITRLEGRIRSINGTKMQGMKGQASNQATMNLSIAPALGQLTRLENKVKETVAFINAQRPTLKLSTAEANVVKQRQQAAQEAQNAEDASKKATAAQAAHIRTLARERYALYDVAATYQMVSRALLGFTNATLKGAADYERAFVNVQRTTDFVSIKNRFDSLNEAARVMKYSFMQLATQIPLTFKDITEIATIGNQLGIAQGKLKEFTQTTAQFAATTDVTINNAALSFGRIGELLSGKGQTVDYNKLGSAIAYAGVKAVATEAQILSVTKEISTTAKMAKFTAPEVVGLATALSSVGVAPEAARGSIIRSFAAINNAITVGGSKLKGYADIAGMSSEQFAKTWQKNGQQAFNAFLSGLQSMSDSGMNLDSVLRNLGIKNVRDIQTIQKLGDNYNVYADSIANANKAYADGTFLAESYGKIQDTVSAKLDLMKNNFDNLMATLGNGFTGDMFKGILDAVNALLKGLTDTARSPFGQWVAGTAIALAGLLGAIAAINGAVALGRAAMLAFATAMDVTKVAADGVTVSIDRAALAGKIFNTTLKATAWLAAIGVIIYAIGKIADAFTPVEQKAESILGGFAGLQDAFTSDTKALQDNAAAAGMTAEAYAAAHGILLVHTAAIAANDQAARDAQAAHDGLNLIVGNEADTLNTSSTAIEGQTIAIGANTVAWLKNAMVQSKAFQDASKNGDFIKSLAASGYNFNDALAAGIQGADTLNAYFDKLRIAAQKANPVTLFLDQYTGGYAEWDTLKNAIAGTANEVLLLGLGADKTTPKVDALTKTTTTGANNVAKAAGSIKEVIRTVVDYASDLAGIFKRIDDIKFGRRAALDSIASGWKTLSDRINGARTAMIAAKQTIDSLTADRRVLEYQLSIAQKYGDVLRAAEIQAQLAKNTQDAADAQANYNKAKVESTTATTGPAGAQNRSSFMGLLQQYQGYITALAAAGVKGYALQRAIAPLKADFRDQAKALGFTSEQVDKFVTSFDDYKNVIKFTPRDVTVEFRPKRVLLLMLWKSISLRSTNLMLRLSLLMMVCLTLLVELVV